MMKLKCEAYREWMALELYDELKAGQAEELEAHITGCEPCLEAKRVLAAGVTIFPKTPASSLPAPTGDADWLQRIRLEARPERVRVRSRWMHVAASFAAGVVTAVALGWSNWGPSSPGTGLSEATAGSIALPEPPPPATSPGRLSQLSHLSHLVK